MLRRYAHPCGPTTGRRNKVGPPILSISATVFVRATEDEEKVKRALELVLPPQEEQKGMKIDVERKIASGVLENPIIVMKAKTERRSDARKWWKHILSILSKEDVGHILKHSEDFLDELGRIHFRFNKQEACRGKPVIASGGGVIKVRAQLEAYPAKPEEFKKAFEQAFTE